MRETREPTPAKLDWTELDDKAVDTVRVLAMDAVQKVGNGHPGTAMSLAPAAYLLFQKVMRHDPADPHWPAATGSCSRCGHSSLTLYIQLFLGGFGLELEDLKALRTWGSKTPGHPEYGHTAGVETTTGPLGQGVGNAVGMAMAARREHGLLDPNAAPGELAVRPPHLRHVLRRRHPGGRHRPRPPRSPASSELGNLTLIYDDNRISIEDDTDIAFTEDVGARYEAYGWHVQHVDWTNGGTKYEEDVPALYDAIRKARGGHRQAQLHRARTRSSPGRRPTRRTPARRTARALGADEVAATKKVLGFDPEQTFEVAAGRPRAHPAGSSSAARPRRPRGTSEYAAWARKPSADTRPLRPAADPHPPRRLGDDAADVRGRREGRSRPASPPAR